jgi:hypothetical protein
VPRRRPPRVPRSRNRPKRRTRRITYNVQAIQSLRNVDVPKRTKLQARAIQNRAAMATAFNRTASARQQFAQRYTGGLTLFNALPQIITSLTNRPLQTAINYGTPAVQKAILQGVGVYPGAGLARVADTMIRGGAAGGIPGLNFGSGLFFADAPSGAVNIPENRPSYFGEQPSRAGGQPPGFWEPQRWSTGR